MILSSIKSCDIQESDTVKILAKEDDIEDGPAILTNDSLVSPIPLNLDMSTQSKRFLANKN